MSPFTKVVFGIKPTVLYSAYLRTGREKKFGIDIPLAEMFPTKYSVADLY